MYAPPTPGAPGYPAYGQPGAPSYPMYAPPAPGTVPLPGYSYPPGYAPPVFAPAPPPPPHKPHTGLIIGIVVLIVVLIIAGIGGLFLLANLGAHNAQPVPASSISATATAAATTTVAAQVLLNDPLTANTYGWANVTNECFFKADGYHVANNYVCFAPIQDIADGSITVDVKQISGGDRYSYGLSFRVESPGNLYNFTIDSLGHWIFYKDANGTAIVLHDFTTNSAIRIGLNVTNRHKVVMSGTHFDFYVNGTLVGSADDSTFTQAGHVGLRGPSGGEVVFTNALITTPMS
jgi:hypothetical protein